MKTKFFLFAAWLMITGNLSAQDPGQEYTDRMNYIFQQTDKSRITTGLLSDYGLQMIEPSYFNGVPADSNYVDMDTWKMLYSGIYTSKINNNISLTSPETVFSQIDNAVHATAVPVAMMHYQYNQLNENAVNLGLLQVVNDQIIDVPGAASPYLTKQLFAVAPKELSFDGPTARFVFKSNLWYTNSGKTIQKREINFNNESGYLIANWDAPVGYTFSTGGVKTVYFRLTYTDGTSYTGQTNILVTETTASLRASQAGAENIPIQATSQHSGGTMQIRLSTYNNTGQIRKPLIVAEGFDASCIIGEEYAVDVTNFLNNTNSSTSVGSINVPYPGTTTTLYGRINLAQYDIIYLDYNYGVDDIWRNAQLFKEVINKVNTELKVGNEPNVVMGISMGGLVARIALRQMEQAGQNHQTSKYISVDSPHKGANVPVGFQAAVRHMQNTNLQVFFINVMDYNNFEEIKGAVNLLNSMAAKQMLIYTVNQNYGFDNTVHNNFQQAYDQLGFPQQCENIAISNGSNNGSLSFTPGSAIIDWRDSYSFKWWMDILSIFLSEAFIATNFPQLVLNAIPGHSQVKMELNIDALKNQSASRIYKGKVYIRKTVLWLVPVNINVLEKTVNSTSSMLPVDGAPGGLYTMSMMGNNLPFPPDAIKQSQFCFVPTVSSLALSDWNTKLTQNLNGVVAPFHYVFTQGNNELHTRFNSSASFLYNQLTNVPMQPTPPVLTGPSIFNTSATFQVQNLPVYGTITLQTSSGLSASISGNTITVNSNYPGEGWLRMSVTTAFGTVTSNTVRFIHGEYIPQVDISGGDVCVNNGCYMDCCVEIPRWFTNISSSTVNLFQFCFSSDIYRSLVINNFTYQARIVRSSTGTVVYTLPGTFNGSCQVVVDYYGLQANTWYDLEVRLVTNNPNSSWHNVGGVNAITRSSAYSLSLGEFTLYPNPGDGVFTLEKTQSSTLQMSSQSSSQSTLSSISGNQSESLLVRIYTALTGILVKELPVSFSGAYTVNASDLPQGNYVVQIIRGNEIVQSTQIRIQ